MSTKTSLKLLRSSCYALFLFFSITTHSQNIVSAKDSIHLYTYKALDNLAAKNYYSNPTLSKKYAEISLRKAQLDQNDERIANALMRIALMEAELQKFDLAHDLSKKAINIVQNKLKDSAKLIDYKFYQGNIYNRATNYENALDNYITVYNYKKKYENEDSEFLMEITCNIAMIRIFIGDIDKAINLLKKNYTILSNRELKKLPSFNSTTYISILISLSNAYIQKTAYKKEVLQKTQLLDSASKYVEIGLKKSILYKDANGHNYFLIRKALIAYQKGAHTTAIDILRGVIERTEKMEQKDALYMAYFHIAKNYQKLSMFDEAIYFFDKIILLLQQIPEKPAFSSDVYASLTDIYIQKKDIKNSLKYQELFIENRKEEKTAISNISQKIYTQYDEALLKDKIQVLIVEVDTNKQKTRTIFILIGFVVIAFLGAYIYFTKEQRKNYLKYQKILKEIHTKEETTKPTKKTTLIKIDDEKVTHILKALDTFEEKKQFLNMNCDLTYVAKKVNTNKAYLSKVIHEEKRQKFIQYITGLRIEYALRQLQEDKTLQAYTISAIATELGFKSAGTFTKAFKEKTGLLPSYYIKKVKAEKK